MGDGGFENSGFGNGGSGNGGSGGIGNGDTGSGGIGSGEFGSGVTEPYYIPTISTPIEITTEQTTTEEYTSETTSLTTLTTLTSTTATTTSSILTTTSQTELSPTEEATTTEMPEDTTYLLDLGGKCNPIFTKYLNYLINKFRKEVFSSSSWKSEIPFYHPKKINYLSINQERASKWSDILFIKDSSSASFKIKKLFSDVITQKIYWDLYGISYTCRFPQFDINLPNKSLKMYSQNEKKYFPDAV